MTALPADISKYTKDGVVVTLADETVRDAHPDAVDQRETEIEMFYANAADAQAMLQERFDILSKVNAITEAIEIDEGLELGTTIPLTPSVPCFTIVDETRGIETVVRARAFAYDTGQERFSIEVQE